MSVMDNALMRVRADELTFGEFVCQTNTDWQRLASKLMSRWHLPPSVATEDVVQELLAACWLAIPKWEPGRGPSISKYCVFIAMASAKDWLNKQRDSKGRRDHTHSRYPIAFSMLSVGEAKVVDYVVCLPLQESVVEQKASFEQALAGCKTDREQLCLLAVVESKGSIDDAVSWLYDDTDIRLLGRFACRGDARRSIWRTASRVRERRSSQ
tara:strand:- start:2404 stop:3036 length:633 start_codon:yes stop_codon:yes gene_type:complete